MPLGGGAYLQDRWRMWGNLLFLAPSWGGGGIRLDSQSSSSRTGSSLSWRLWLRSSFCPFWRPLAPLAAGLKEPSLAWRVLEGAPQRLWGSSNEPHSRVTGVKVSFAQGYFNMGYGAAGVRTANPLFCIIIIIILAHQLFFLELSWRWIQSLCPFLYFNFLKINEYICKRQFGQRQIEPLIKTINRENE